MATWETFGAALAVVASIVSNLGVNIQKFSHAREAARPTGEQRAYVQRPVWWVGLSLVVLGSIGDFAAFGFATQSLVAALGGGSTLIANVVTAHFLNGEHLFLTDAGGVLFVILGVVTIAFIAEPNEDYPLPELEKRFVRTEFVVYIVTVGLCTVSMLATIKGSVANRIKNQVQWSNRRQKQRMKQFEMRVQRLEQRLFDMEERFLKFTNSNNTAKATTDDSAAAKAKASSALVAPRSHQHTSMEHLSELLLPADQELEQAQETRVPYYYAICSGIVGAMTVLLAKCSAIMVALSLKGDNQFKYGLTYVFIGGMFVCIMVQTHFLNMATALGDIMTVFPIFQACWITFSVVGGAIFYETDATMSTREALLYTMALLSIAFGVGLLVQHGSQAEAKESPGRVGKRGATSGDDDDAADEDMCLITDTSMTSPLLPSGAVDDSGYLHLDA